MLTKHQCGAFLLRLYGRYFYALRGEKKCRGGLMLSLQEMTWVVSILSFAGGIAIFLFKKIVIEPLENSINSLNETLREFKMTTDRELEIHEREIDLLKEKTTRHDEQIKTLFSSIKGGKRND